MNADLPRHLQKSHFLSGLFEFYLTQSLKNEQSFKKSGDRSWGVFSGSRAAKHEDNNLDSQNPCKWVGRSYMSQHITQKMISAIDPYATHKQTYPYILVCVHTKHTSTPIYTLHVHTTHKSKHIHYIHAYHIHK